MNNTGRLRRPFALIFLCSGRDPAGALVHGGAARPGGARIAAARFRAALRRSGRSGRALHIVGIAASARNRAQRARTAPAPEPAAAAVAPRGIGGAFVAEWRRVLAIRGAFALLVLGPLLYGVYYPQPYLNQILRKIRIAVVDNDLSELSRNIVQTLDASGAVSVAVRAETFAEARAALDRGEAFAVVGIPPDGARRAQGQYRPHSDLCRRHLPVHLQNHGQRHRGRDQYAVLADIFVGASNRALSVKNDNRSSPNKIVIRGAQPHGYSLGSAAGGSLAVPAFSYYLSRKTGSDWFARSGSIMGLSGAAVAFRLAHFYQGALATALKEGLVSVSREIELGLKPPSPIWSSRMAAISPASSVPASGATGTCCSNSSRETQRRSGPLPAKVYVFCRMERGAGSAISIKITALLRAAFASMRMRSRWRPRSCCVLRS